MTDKDFEILFRDHFASLCNLAYTIVKDSDSAKDVVQQVFINYWQLREKIILRGPAKGYLYKAVVNTALNHASKTKRLVILSEQLTGTIPDIPAEEENKDKHIKVHKVIKELPPVCQKVFMLSRFSDLTNKEIANELGISVKAVEKHISKALRTLREKLRFLLTSELMLLIFMLLRVPFFFLLWVGFFILILSINK